MFDCCDLLEHVWTMLMMMLWICYKENWRNTQNWYRYMQLQDPEVIFSELIGSNRAVFDNYIYTLLLESVRKKWSLGQTVILWKVKKMMFPRFPGVAGSS